MPGIATNQLADGSSFVRGNTPDFVITHGVDVIATVNVDLSSPGASIDGVGMSAGDTFLAAAQTTTVQKGKYVFNGDAVAATRSPDFDSADQWRIGTEFQARNGSQAGRTWRLTSLTTVPPTIGV